MKSFILVFILGFCLAGCAVSSSRLSLDDEQGYCTELYAYSRILNGSEVAHVYQNSASNEFRQADVKFYEILSKVIQNGHVSQDEYIDFWNSIAVLEKFLQPGAFKKECIGKHAAIMDFLAEFYKSAIESYEKQAVYKTDRLVKMLERPTNMWPKSCYYIEGRRHDQLSAATYITSRIYNSELNKFKKCFKPYMYMLSQVSKRENIVVFSMFGGRLFESYDFKNHQESYKELVNRAKKAEDAIKILTDKNYKWR